MRYNTRNEHKALKEHICTVCSWTINQGETYSKHTTLDSGTVSVWKSHITPCEIATERAFIAGYGYDGLVTTDDVAAWADDYEEENEHAAELQRRLNINTKRQTAKHEAGLLGVEE